MQRPIPFSKKKKIVKRNAFLKMLGVSVAIPLTIFGLGLSAIKHNHKKEMQRIEMDDIKFRERMRMEEKAHLEVMKKEEAENAAFLEKIKGKVPRYYYKNYEDYENRAPPSKVEWINLPSSNSPSLKGPSNPTNKSERGISPTVPAPQIFIGKKQVPQNRLISRHTRSSLSKRRA
jgi:hypothetical protein